MVSGLEVMIASMVLGMFFIYGYLDPTGGNPRPF